MATDIRLLWLGERLPFFKKNWKPSLDTQPQETPSIDEEDDGDELLPDLWVERNSSLIYEVRFLETCIIVRPVTPSFYMAIRKMSHMEFARDFEEFCGDHEAVREFVRGEQPEFIVL